MPDKIVCTCEDQNAMTPCPVHVKPGFQDGYGAGKVIVTDENMINQTLSTMRGFKFRCPECKLDSILEIFNFCPNCGVGVSVQSEYIRKIVQEINKKARQQT